MQIPGSYLRPTESASLGMNLHLWQVPRCFWAIIKFQDHWDTAHFQLPLDECSHVRSHNLPSTGDHLFRGCCCAEHFPVSPHLIFPTALRRSVTTDPSFASIHSINKYLSAYCVPGSVLATGATQQTWLLLCQLAFWWRRQAGIHSSSWLLKAYFSNTAPSLALSTPATLAYLLGALLPQGLCTCCSLCLDAFPHESLTACPSLPSGVSCKGNFSVNPFLAIHCSHLTQASHPPSSFCSSLSQYV